MHFENVLKRILILLWIYSAYYTSGITAESQLGDPYSILGVERKASATEIRQAYKKLVKKWYEQCHTPSSTYRIPSGFLNTKMFFLIE